MSKKLEKRISKIEKHLVDNLKINQKFLVTVFYLLGVLCIAYPILYYTLFVHEYNFESTITFLYMLMGMILGFGSCLFLLIANALDMKKVKL